MPKHRTTRDWTAARGKVDREGRCRVCRVSPGDQRHGSTATLEAAHTIGREHDAELPGPLKGKLFVDPRDVVPLCGPSADSRSCHRRYDMRELDLLPYLTHDEQAAAVSHVGIVAAYRRLACTRDPIT